MQIDRRGFVVSAVAGAFSLGWRVPQAAAQATVQSAAAASGPGEIGVWAVVHPDDSIVVRIARSEMDRAP
ncbi:MAG: hypothetical protein NVSMB18_16590 [Acetobacteraceae bacterium]